ncbi:MAG: signal peptidase I [Pirellulales bacterium]
MVLTGTVMWVVELVSTINAWPPADGTPAVASYRGKAALWMLAAVGFGAALVTSFRLVRIEGEGMAPLVWNKDRLLFHTRVDSAQLQRGQVILFGLAKENQITDAGALMLARILAVPGDKLTVVNYRYQVNDEVSSPLPIETDLPKALQVPRAPETITIPDGCYFVVQDDREDGLDSQVVGYAKRDQIISTSVFQLERSPFLKRLQ